MPDLRLFLDPPARAAFDDAARLMSQGRRREALTALGAFVEAIRDYPQSRKAQIAEALCRQTVDINRTDLLRQPLLTSFLFPQLRIGREAKLPNYSRWLAELYDRVRVPGGLEAAGLGKRDTPTILYHEALRIDPNDARARAGLIECLRGQLDYWFHEVPSGVLARANEMDYVRRTIEEFQKLLVDAGRQGDFQEEIEWWSFHCEAWADYLSRRQDFAGYSDYLIKTGHEDRL